MSPEVTAPTWNILIEGSATAVRWVDHAPNPRFAIYDPNADSDPAHLADNLESLVDFGTYLGFIAKPLFLWLH